MSKSTNWKSLFKVVGIQPGPVFHAKTGRIDLSNENVPITKVKALYDVGCNYLELTEEGEKYFANTAKEKAQPNVEKK